MLRQDSSPFHGELKEFLSSATYGSIARLLGVSAVLQAPKPELFFAIVSPVGSDTDAVCEELIRLLRNVGYTPTL